MKDEVLKILELLEKGVISSDEANSLIKEIRKNEGEETTENFQSEDNTTSTNKKTNSVDGIYNSFENGLRNIGDKVNEFITKVQPEVLKATQVAADKLAESSKKFSEKVDSKLSEENKQKNTTSKTNVEVDDIIKNYEEEE
ncbi:MAG: SHOCT-like domain-containing protein [Lachnospirales bacterium]